MYFQIVPIFLELLIADDIVVEIWWVANCGMYVATGIKYYRERHRELGCSYTCPRLRSKRRERGTEM